MTYNKTPRRSLTTLQRAKLFEEHGGICYLCQQKIHPGEAWDDEHVIARELMGEGADDMANRRPAHRSCHAPKTANDRKLIAKSNRVRASHMGAKQPGSLPGKRIKYSRARNVYYDAISGEVIEETGDNHGL